MHLRIRLPQFVCLRRGTGSSPQAGKRIGANESRISNHFGWNLGFGPVLERSLGINFGSSHEDFRAPLPDALTRRLAAFFDSLRWAGFLRYELIRRPIANGAVEN